MVSSLYLHVPFCTQKCRYCSFFSVAKNGEETGYFSLILPELRAGAAFAQELKTVYLGGGTPSCMPQRFVPEVMEAIAKYYRIAPDAEITVEANPETMTPQLAKCWCAAGVNRISLGVQSFDPMILQFLGRQHTAQQALDAVSCIRAAGITNLNLDLIYGIAGLDFKRWEQTLLQALYLKVPHLSCYALTVEEGTPLWRMQQDGHAVQCDEDAESAQRLLATQLLHTAGLYRYEISNYAKPESQSRHNGVYWAGRGYLGIGAGAHGALQLGKELIRYENPADLGLYAAMACERQFFVGRRIPLREQMFERVMLNTRRLQGLDEAEFQRDFDVPFVQCFPESCRKAIEFGLAQRKDGWFLLTQRGLEVQNAMLVWFLEEIERQAAQGPCENA